MTPGWIEGWLGKVDWAFNQFMMERSGMAVKRMSITISPLPERPLLAPDRLGKQRPWLRGCAFGVDSRKQAADHEQTD
jgi:hypothetical protein